MRPCLDVLVVMLLVGCIFGASVQNTIGKRNVEDVAFAMSFAQIDRLSPSQERLMEMAYEKMLHREQHVVAFWCMWSAMTVVLCLFAESVLDDGKRGKEPKR